MSLIVRTDLCKFRLLIHANHLRGRVDLGRSEREGISYCVHGLAGGGLSRMLFYGVEVTGEAKQAASSPPHVLCSTAPLHALAPDSIVLKKADGQYFLGSHILLKVDEESSGILG